MTNRLYIITVLLTTISCRQPLASFDKIEGAYRYKISIVDSMRFYYKFKTETMMETRQGDVAQKSESNAEVGLIYSYFKDSASNIRIKVTYDRMIIRQKNVNGESEYSASQGGRSFDLIENALNSIMGTSIYFYIDTARNIISTLGATEMESLLMTKLSNIDPDVRKNIVTMMNNKIGINFLKASIEKQFKLLPSMNVIPGQTWQSINSETGDFSFDVVTKNVLEEIDNGLANVTSEGKYKHLKINALDDGSGSTDLSGEITSKYVIDTSNGILKSSKVSTTIKGSVFKFGKETEIDLVVNTSAEALKLK